MWGLGDGLGLQSIFVDSLRALLTAVTAVLVLFWGGVEHGIARCYGLAHGCTSVVTSAVSHRSRWDAWRRSEANARLGVEVNELYVVKYELAFAYEVFAERVKVGS